MNLARESFYTLIFQVSSFLCAAITGMIIARTLGPSNKGIIAVALLYPSFFFTICNLTIGLTIIHHLGKREYDIKDFLGSALLILAAMSAVAIAFFFGSVGFFRDTLYKGIESKYLILAGFSIPFYLMLYYFSSILQGSLDIKGYNIANQLPAFSNLFFVLVFISLWKLTAVEAVIAGISGTVIGGFLSLVKAARKAKGIFFNSELSSLLLKDGLKIHIGAIATFLYSQANVFILNYYSTSSEVGFYSVAYSLANILLFFSVSLEIGLYPKVAHANMEDAVALVRAATRHIIFITGSAALFMAIFSKWIVLIYGGRAFLPSVTPLLLLMPGVIMFVISKILSTLWIRKGWFFPLTFIACLTAAVNGILSMILIPKYGSNGAAIANSIAFFFNGIISVILYYKFIDSNILRLVIFEKNDLAVYNEYYTNLKEMLRKVSARLL